MTREKQEKCNGWPERAAKTAECSNLLFDSSRIAVILQHWSCAVTMQVRSKRGALTQSCATLETRRVRKKGCLDTHSHSALSRRPRPCLPLPLKLLSHLAPLSTNTLLPRLESPNSYWKTALLIPPHCHPIYASILAEQLNHLPPGARPVVFVLQLIVHLCLPRPILLRR